MKKFLGIILLFLGIGYGFIYSGRHILTFHQQLDAGADNIFVRDGDLLTFALFAGLIILVLPLIIFKAIDCFVNTSDRGEIPFWQRGLLGGLCVFMLVIWGYGYMYTGTYYGDLAREKGYVFCAKERQVGGRRDLRSNYIILYTKSADFCEGFQDRMISVKEGLDLQNAQ